MQVSAASGFSLKKGDRGSSKAAAFNTIPTKSLYYYPFDKYCVIVE
jgi:hypothetical protein